MKLNTILLRGVRNLGMGGVGVSDISGCGAAVAPGKCAAESKIVRMI
ncbi:hypothetical protein J7M07_06660 [bacterium]|nr:hypothetical protein [bacterium]